MLDAETKAKIDSARDILVGKVPDPKSQVEQITIALIYKFMDDMDRQSEELGGKATFFSGDFKKYCWAQLLDKRFGGHERLLLYAEGIEKMNVNKNTPQLFWDIFKGVFLPYRDPETLMLMRLCAKRGIEPLEAFDQAWTNQANWIGAGDAI